MRLLPLCCLLIPLALPAAMHEPVAVLDGDALALEAEIEPLASGWVCERDIAGHLGDGYLRWAAPDSYGVPGTGELRYRILVASAGRYRVDLRLNTAGASRSDLGNDAFTRFDQGPWVKTFVGGGSAEGWATRTRLEPSHGNFAEPVYELSAGLHSFAIAGRSHGLRIDRIIIWRADAKQPPDILPASSGLPAIPAELDDPAVRSAWRQGGLGAVLTWAEKRRKDPAAAPVTQALIAHADDRLAAITARHAEDALLGLDLLEILAAQYHGSERGRELAKTVRAWSAEPQVAKERKAREMATAVAKLLADHASEADPARKTAMAAAIRSGMQVMRRACEGTRPLADTERLVTAAALTQ